MQEVIGFDIDIGGIYIKTEKSKSPPPPSIKEYETKSSEAKVNFMQGS